MGHPAQEGDVDFGLQHYCYRAGDKGRANGMTPELFEVQSSPAFIVAETFEDLRSHDKVYHFLHTQDGDRKL